MVAGGLTPPTEATFRDTIMPGLVTELQQHLRTLLQPVDFASITVGSWNRAAGSSFITVKVAWINVFKAGWPRQRATLTLGPVPEEYPSASLALHVGELLKHYGLGKYTPDDGRNRGLDESCIQWGTSDSASNVVKCSKDLKLAR